VCWLAAVVTGAWAAERWPVLQYAHTGYQLDRDGLQVRRGVLWQTVTHVPRSRVQHTDVSQGPLERRYGLGTLVVYTAGTDHARVALPGLAHEVARELRDELRPERVDDAV
jgi:membrane protein YdbS with pleckstrin-like domain